MYRSFIKRLLDIVFSILLLPVLLLVILLLSPIIWINDKGPVFYCAKRNREKGKTFNMIKFRTMYVNSPDLRNDDGSTYSADNDPRVTPIGKVLRKLSLDEFPQLFNVLFGDMSFIGPRPTVGEVDYLNMTGDKKKRYSIKPGITGYSQAFYRNSITQEEKYRYDAYYADNLSFSLDLRILWQTFVSVLLQRNINTKHK